MSQSPAAIFPANNWVEVIAFSKACSSHSWSAKERTAIYFSHLRLLNQENPRDLYPNLFGKYCNLSLWPILMLPILEFHLYTRTFHIVKISSEKYIIWRPGNERAVLLLKYETTGSRSSSFGQNPKSKHRSCPIRMLGVLVLIQAWDWRSSLSIVKIKSTIPYFSNNYSG